MSSACRVRCVDPARIARALMQRDRGADRAIAPSGDAHGSVACAGTLTAYPARE